MMNKLQKLVFYSLLACLPMAPSAAPELRLPSLGSAGLDAITSAEEDSIGRQIVANLRNAGLVIDDPELSEYIQDVGNRLIGASETHGQEFHFYIIKDDSINAFALPGGYIGINAGLIRRTSNESELASVMAHEIAHVTQRHIARRVEESRTQGLQALATMLGAFAVLATGGDADDIRGTLMLGQGLLQQSQINFTRGQEYEADRVGIELLANAEFNPQGMIDFFEILQRMQRLSGSRLPEYFSTHPLGGSRVVEATERARAITVEDPWESRMYPLIKARLDTLNGEPVERPGKLAQDASPADRYHHALKLLAYGDAEKAGDIFATLIEEDDSLIPYHLGLARALAATGDMERTASAIDEALRLFPDSVPVGLTYARLQRDMDEPGRGLRHLRRLFDTHTPSPEDLRLMAQLAADSGTLAESHFYLSEYYLRQHNLMAARLQLQLAVQFADLGSNERQQYQARLEEVTEVLAKQRQSERRERGAGRG